MVKRDEYNYQELRRQAAMADHEIKILKVLIGALNKELKASKIELARSNARFAKVFASLKLEDVEEKDYIKPSLKKAAPGGQGNAGRAAQQNQNGVHIVGGRQPGDGNGNNGNGFMQLAPGNKRGAQPRQNGQPGGDIEISFSRRGGGGSFESPI